MFNCLRCLDTHEAQFTFDNTLLPKYLNGALNWRKIVHMEADSFWTATTGRLRSSDWFSLSYLDNSVLLNKMLSLLVLILFAAYLYSKARGGHSSRVGQFGPYFFHFSHRGYN